LNETPANRRRSSNSLIVQFHLTGKRTNFQTMVVAFCHHHVKFRD